MFVYLILAILAYYVLRKVLDRFEIGKYDERYVFITGCDTGFGNMLAVRLDDMGFHVFAGCLTRSGKESLQKICSKRLQAVEIDVTHDASIENCLEEVKQKLPPNKGLWAVVNNAGRVCGVGPTQWLTRKEYEDTLAVNLYGPVFVTKAFLPLVQVEKGRVINMSSIGGRFHILEAAYCSSKAAVEAYSDVLRRELWGTGVSVHIIEPGFFRTTLFDVETRTNEIRAKIESLPSHIKEKLPPNIKELMIQGFHKVLSWASPDTYQVTDAYVHAITAKFPKPRYLVGRDAKVKFRILMYLPECVSDYIVNIGRPNLA